MPEDQHLYDALFHEATEGWQTAERDALNKRLTRKVQENPKLWTQHGRGEERRETFIEWMNEEASRFIEAAAKLRGVGTEPSNS